MNKLLKYEIYAGIVLFLVLLILGLAKVISIAWVVSGLIISIVLGLLIWALIIYKKKQTEEKVEEKKTVKLITDDEAEELVKKELFELSVLEYVGDDIYKDTWYKGAETKSPIYVRKFRGIFDKQIISILVNLQTKKIGRKTYDDSKEDEDVINKDISSRANLLAETPEEKPDIREIFRKDPLSRIEEKIIEKISKKKEIPDKKEDKGLK